MSGIDSVTHGVESVRAVMSVNLADLIALADQDAALKLNERIAVLDEIARVYERSYAERGIIIREFERRSLWKLLLDPSTGAAFSCMTAWMSCSNYLGCRRVNFEAKGDFKILDELPAEKLIDVPKGNIKILVQASTDVRNNEAVLEDAKTMDRDEFLAKLATTYPDQHFEVPKHLRFSPGMDGAKIVEDGIQFAIDHDIAGSRDEALVRAFETAVEDWQQMVTLEEASGLVGKSGPMGGEVVAIEAGAVNMRRDFGVKKFDPETGCFPIGGDEVTDELGVELPR